MHRHRDAHRHPHARDRGGRPGTEAAGRLRRLHDLRDYEVADGYPDVRRWTVKTSDGTTIGEVEDLIVDTQALRVRYLVVELAGPFRNATHTASVGEAIRQAARRAAGAAADVAHAPPPDAGEGHTLLPVGGVRLDDARDEVVVEHLTSEQILGLPRYGGLALTDEYESAVRRRLFEGGTPELADAPRADAPGAEIVVRRPPAAGDRPGDAAPGGTEQRY
jgi:hypothetical protein